MYHGLQNAPTLKLDTVWHVGTLNPADKRNDSQEGNGLSVSVHPDEWTYIAKLGGGDIYQLTKPGGRFLDFNRLTKKDWQALQEWGIAGGCLQMQERWQVRNYDSELDADQVQLCLTKEAALRELYDPAEADTRVKPVQVPCLSQLSVERVGFSLDPLMAARHHRHVLRGGRDRAGRRVVERHVGHVLPVSPSRRHLPEAAFELES